MITNTVIFPWNANFNTGLPIIDEQHRKLVDLLNNLATHLVYGVDRSGLNRVFAELADYAVYHFETEEKIWKLHLSEDEMTRSHIKTHESFVVDVLKLKDDLGGLSDDEVVDEVVSFLTHWLAFHILDTDKHMAKIVIGLQQGLSLQTAKEKASVEMSGAMRVLIETVLTMYDSLSSRTLELMREIAERQRAEQDLRLFKKVIDGTFEAMFITDVNCKIIDTNPSFCLKVKREHDALTGLSVMEIMPNLFDLEKKDEILHIANLSGNWSGEVTGRGANGEVEAVWLTLTAIKDTQGEVTHYIGILSSISLLLERQQSLLADANNDALTGLPNRRLLDDRLEQAIVRSQRSHRLLAVCFLDLDGFKQVNDTLGHEAGDEVLRVTAARLTKVLRGEDTIARIGGDEFILLLGELNDDVSLKELLNRLLQDIAQPILIHGKLASVTASIGITMYPNDQGKPDELLTHADKAMYSAKNSGKSQYWFYN
ncbi:MAG: bacteriohemerythrin [Methylotenera sp.]|nr:bacteriohemerythrin [Methylotenera sp.]MDD4924970.1 bacteriohemerythrin [Methylotenera sp.]